MSAPAGGDWRAAAACRSIPDPDVFFPAAADGPVYAAQVAIAKAVCARCDVRAACLEEALSRIPEGIAGGLTPEERRALRAGRHGPISRERVAAVELDVLELGLRRRAHQAQVRAAGRVLLAAGRPVREVAARCGVSERTATRWATTTRQGNPTHSATTTAGRGAGKGRGSNRALPLISHTNPLAGTRAEGTRG